MRAAPSRKSPAESGRIWRALHARGIGWVILAVLAMAAVVAWLITLSTESLASVVPVDRRQSVLGEIVSVNLVTWAVVMGLAVALSMLLLWLLGGWIRVADRVARSLGVLVAPHDGVDALQGEGDSSTYETTSEEVDATTHAVATRLRAIATQTQSFASSVAEITRDTTALKRAIEQLLDDGDAATGEAASNLNRVGETTLSLKSDVESLAGRAEEASSSALEAVAHSDEITESLHRFVGAFDSAAATGDEAVALARGLAQKVSDFEGDVRGAQSDAKDVAAGLGQFEIQLAETVRAAERHSAETAQAIAAFHEAAVGIEKLSGVASASTAAVGQLGQKIGQITRALSVINEVAEETNLLALNAAIIAAQAGEHGRAFGVVADEIKELAERVGSSTRDIAALVKAVVGESTAALRTIEGGLGSVQVAAAASARVEALLASLKDGAEGGVGGARALLSQLGGENRKAGGVSQAMVRVAAAIDDMSRAVSGLVDASSRAGQGDEAVRTLAAGLVRAANDEVRNAKQVVRAVEKLLEIGRRLGLVQAEQAKQLVVVQTATARSRGVVAEGRRLNVGVDQMLARVDRMSAEIARSERVLPASLGEGAERR